MVLVRGLTRHTLSPSRQLDLQPHTTICAAFLALQVQQAAAARGEASAKASLAAAQSRVDKLTADVARLTAANLSLRNSTET